MLPGWPPRSSGGCASLRCLAVDSRFPVQIGYIFGSQILSRGLPWFMTAENDKGGGRAGPTQTRIEEQELSPQEYEHLLAQYENSFKNLQEGQIIRGRVLSVTPSEVIVDIGYKSEGIIPVSEFTDFSGNVLVKPGDAVDVLLERTEDQHGYVGLSKDKAEKRKVWGEVEKSYRSGSTVRGRVI